MCKSKPLGIRSTLWLAIALTVASTMLGAGAIHGYQLYRRAEAAEVLRIQALAAAYAAQAGIWLNRSRDELSTQVDHLQWHPDVCLLAVVAEDPARGTTTNRASTSTMVLKLRGDARLLDHFLKDADAQSARAMRLTLSAPSGSRQASPELYLAAVPIRLPGSDRTLATLVCGARSASRYLFTSREIAVFFIRLVVVAGAGALMGFWWLSRTVVRPLARLARHSADASLAQDDGQQAERDDEIGNLARALSDMHISLEEWRERATHLERSVNQRVASETQRVSRELQQANRKIWTDALTQLGNRRLLEDRLGEIFAAQREAKQDLSVIMIDVDNFKKLNDTKGHAAGDAILRFIGELLKQSLREQDLAIRYGGDEFILLLPAVTLRDAEKIAQRTVLLFNQQARLLSVEHKPSMSAGVASLWEQKPETPEELLEMADKTLYQAKRGGKSCVRTAPPAPRRAVAASR